MGIVQQLHHWHSTKPGLLVAVLAELMVAYVFASLAIDHGNLIYYLLALILLIGSLQNLFKFVGKLFYVKK
jgi:hypothetical protein